LASCFRTVRRGKAIEKGSNVSWAAGCAGFDPILNSSHAAKLSGPGFEENANIMWWGRRNGLK
jgi:hypothetical protein